MKKTFLKIIASKGAIALLIGFAFMHISCSEEKVKETKAPNIILILADDLGIGDIFSVRIAGNVVNEDILGGLEYACEVVRSRVVLVLSLIHI